MAKEAFLVAAKRCCENGRRLLDETEFLGFEEPQATRYYLSVVAQEEVAKAFLLYLVAVEALPWTPLLLRATLDHQCKQLVGIILDYIAPDTDEFLRRIERQRLEKNRMQFPANVADAMNLLRHEKMRRWEDKKWFWAEDPEYNEAALRVADGKRDRDKQGALYVELNKNGQVIAAPEQVTMIQAKDEYDRGRRFEECVRGLVGDGPRFAWDLDRVEGCFKALFSEASAFIESQAT